LVSDIPAGDGKTANLFLQCNPTPLQREERVEERGAMVTVSAEGGGGQEPKRDDGQKICYCISSGGDGGKGNENEAWDFSLYLLFAPPLTFN
jgi:hypothetical protein